ncbi:MAG: riboflavin synthase [Crocinitomicaceae bacterium]|nr:riboflavin synthase [Crocinitomicaceae bacterium]
MFTGIIETLGTLKTLREEGTNRHFTLTSDIASELKVDQSVAHDGVCLTVVEVSGDHYTVTAVEETLQRTQLGERSVGDVLNLERCSKIGDRLDGHIVQGHVDTTATVTAIEERGGSWNVHFAHSEAEHHLTVQKGSITVNGVSLTVVDSNPQGFSVTIIPYTWENTGFHRIAVGDRVNLEFDIVGKYVAEMMARRT